MRIRKWRTMKRPKKQKLLIQVGIITIFFFIATLLFVLISDYMITRDAYLSSKEEMIGRDLRYKRHFFMNFGSLDWMFEYANDHPEDMTRELTADERAMEDDITFTEEFAPYLSEKEDPAKADPMLQLLLARHLYYTIDLSLNRDPLEYSRVYLLGILDEHTACYYMDSDSYEDIHFRIKHINYEASDHSAVEKILTEGISDPDETIFEIYQDPEDGKAYYIGYLPVRYEGRIKTMFCVRYDWSDFRSQLLSHAIKSMIIGLLVLIVLNGLLTLFLYRKAIAPVLKVKAGVQDYMNDKDSLAVLEKMNRIPVRNEIGVLADSISDLAAEIDRYTKDLVKLNSEKERISTELALATNIQSSMLPSTFPAFPDRKEFDIYAAMDPAKEVGGDFYDFFLIDDDHLCMIIADVSGKGVPAALFMMSSMIILENHAMMKKTPAQILSDANTAIIKNNQEEMFVTVWLGILELSTGKLTAANGGHEYPAFLGESGLFELYKDKHGMAVGGIEGSRYREYELTIQPGGKLFVYTDGVPEATNKEMKMFGTDRMIEALNEKPEAAPQEILAAVRASVDAFVKEAEQFDDLTMLCLTYYGPVQTDTEHEGTATQDADSKE